MKICRRLKATILTILSLLSLLPVTPALAAHSNFTVENGVLSAYHGPGGDVVIPDGITKIGQRAFYNCEYLTSVTIPNSVTEIGSDAFGWCRKLSRVKLSANLIKINARAFYGCTSLASITIPNSVTEIGEAAFQYCSKLTLVDFGDSIIKIDKSAFSACETLSEVKLPNRITTIGPYVFSGCHLTDITIPDSVTELGDGAFSCASLANINVGTGNTRYVSVDGILFDKAMVRLLAYPSGKLTSVYTVPNGITEIAANAFSYCSGITQIVLPNSVKKIGESAFSQCTGLTSITIPSSVTEIGPYAFSWCSGLTSITLPNSVSKIEDWAFSWCSSLAHITIPAGTTEIGDHAFENSDRLTIHGAAYTQAQSYACKKELPFTANLAPVPTNIPPVPKELAGFCTQEEWEVLIWANRERIAEDLSPLSIFPTLQNVADIREKELASYYSHTRPNGSECFTVLDTMGLDYTIAGENIASGQTSAANAAFAWLRSTGHRKNILSHNYKHVGVGYNGNSELHGNSWEQFFLNKDCSISGISLSQSTATCPVGGSLDSLGLYISAVCSIHGTCYLPLLSGMCSGFDNSAAGEQIVTVTYEGQTTQLQVSFTP